MTIYFVFNNQLDTAENVKAAAVTALLPHTGLVLLATMSK